MSPEQAHVWFGACLQENGFRAPTIRTRLACAKQFTAWLRQAGVTDCNAITETVMISFAHFLQHTISVRTGKPYRPSTKANLWCIALQVMAALYEAGKVPQLIAPVGLIKVSSEPLPTILSEADIANMLDHVDTTTVRGLRDRALFELIYAAGLRASEAVRLTWDDINFNDRLVHIRQSKFDRDRIVPLTHEALEMLKRYHVALQTRETVVFAGRSSRSLTTSWVNRRFKTLAKGSGVYRPGVHVHQLRHACATHMIARGADIRYVQELLGHESVQTTVRYTHDQVEQVRRMYRMYHPRENQLYLEVDDAYRARIEALKTLITASRQKALATL